MSLILYFFIHLQCNWFSWIWFLSDGDEKGIRWKSGAVPVAVSS